MLVHNVIDRRLVLNDYQLISAIIDNDVLVVFGGALTRHLLLDFKFILMHSQARNRAKRDHK